MCRTPEPILVDPPPTLVLVPDVAAGPVVITLEKLGRRLGHPDARIGCRVAQLAAVCGVERKPAVVLAGASNPHRAELEAQRAHGLIIARARAGFRNLQCGGDFGDLCVAIAAQHKDGALARRKRANQRRMQR